MAARTVIWDVERHERAAYLLGRLAASASVAPLAAAAEPLRTPRLYTDMWLQLNVLPALRSEQLWQVPLIADAFDDELRARMLAAADALPSLLDELDGLPIGAAHGDACTRNLLVTGADDGLTLIDFGFWGVGPIGFDLGQLLLGEIQLGERPAHTLAQLEDVCLPAYVEGLHAEGSQATIAQVRRSHAILMTIFQGSPRSRSSTRTQPQRTHCATSSSNAPTPRASSSTCWTQVNPQRSVSRTSPSRISTSRRSRFGCVMVTAGAGAGAGTSYRHRPLRHGGTDGNHVADPDRDSSVGRRSRPGRLLGR